MKLGFEEQKQHYTSGSQSARTKTESWASANLFCPNCGHNSLNQFPANLPVADFYCVQCQEQYELKSQKKPFGRKVANGAYDVKIRRLESESSPSLFLLHYNDLTSSVQSLSVIPKRFFVPSIVERRKPLRASARRAGWVGSNIVIEKVPKVGRISIIADQNIRRIPEVCKEWRSTNFLDQKRKETRGWLCEVMACIDQFENQEFSLADAYTFEPQLSELYPGNLNIRPKIRQQLQVLRDNGYLKFLGRGRYCLSK
ncbi:MAG: DpnI domain-containing protein [Pseudomonadota bacterium]